jgi:hypothetical protein
LLTLLRLVGMIFLFLFHLKPDGSGHELWQWNNSSPEYRKWLVFSFIILDILSFP